jgi:hypothetical protein
MKKNTDKLIAEVFDSEKVLVHCGKHLYAGDIHYPPKEQCPDCWQAFFITLFSLASPERRAEQIDDLTTVGHIWAEQIKKGQYPTIPNTRPVVNVKKDVN